MVLSAVSGCSRSLPPMTNNLFPWAAQEASVTGTGRGGSFFYGAVRFNQQGIFQDALSIVASGHSQPLPTLAKAA